MSNAPELLDLLKQVRPYVQVQAQSLCLLDGFGPHNENDVDRLLRRIDIAIGIFKPSVPLPAGRHHLACLTVITGGLDGPCDCGATQETKCDCDDKDSMKCKHWKAAAGGCPCECHPETGTAPEAPEKTWECTVCGRSNCVTATYCEQCDFSRMVTREGQLVPRVGK